VKSIVEFACKFMVSSNSNSVLRGVLGGDEREVDGGVSV
jgi:hypothetical protein